MAQLNNFRLDMAFNIRGKWSFNYNEMRQGTSGILNFSEEDIYLELIEPLNTTVDELQPIYGYTEDDLLVIINKWEASFHENPTTKFVHHHYVVEEFFIVEFPYFTSRNAIGRVLPTQTDPLRITDLSFSINHLENWIDSSSLKVIYDKQQQVDRIIFDDDFYHSGEYPIPKVALVLRNFQTITFPEISMEDTIQLEDYLKLSTEDGRLESFAFMLEQADSIKNLIELLNQSPLLFNYLEFEGNYMRGRYFFKQIGERLNQTPQNVLRLSQIRANFTHILHHWFEKHDDLYFIVDNYINDLHLPYYIETKLMNSIRNLEIYYRNFNNNKEELSSESFAILKADQEELIHFIRNNIESEQNQNHFIANVQYIGELPLRKKLEYLIKNLPESITQRYIKRVDRSPSRSIDSFVHKLVQTRNYYTHGDKPENYPDRIEDLADMYKINQTLTLVQNYYLLKELGFTTEEVLSFIL